MQHARQVPENATVVIYPCFFCGGLHVGHQKGRRSNRKQDKSPAPNKCMAQNKPGNTPKAVHDLAWSLARIKRRIGLQTVRMSRSVNPPSETIRRHKQAIRDMREHLARLEDQKLPSSQAAGQAKVRIPSADLARSIPHKPDLAEAMTLRCFGHTLTKIQTAQSPPIPMLGMTH